MEVASSKDNSVGRRVGPWTAAAETRGSAAGLMLVQCSRYDPERHWGPRNGGRQVTSNALRCVLCLVAAASAPVPGVAQDSAGVARVLPSAIPIFPLPDLALFPNSTQPFHIFEPRYRAMVADALASDSIIGMVMLQPGYESDYEGRPPIYAMGAAGVIVASEQLPDGRYNIVLQGVAKFRVLEEDESRAYRIADIEELPEADADDRELLASRRRQLESAVRAAFPRAPLPSSAVPDERAIDDLSIMLPLEPAERLEALQADGPLERASTLVRLLRGSVRADLGRVAPSAPDPGQAPPVARRTYSSTFLASTSRGTLPPSRTASLNAPRSKLAPSAVLTRSRCRLISLWPTL